VFLYVEKYVAHMKRRGEICLYKLISLMPSSSVVFVSGKERVYSFLKLCAGT